MMYIEGVACMACFSLIGSLLVPVFSYILIIIRLAEVSSTEDSTCMVLWISVMVKGIILSFG